MIQLSNITSRYYLIYIAIILVGGGFVMMYSIREAFFTNLDKVLAEEKNEIHFSLKGKRLPNQIVFSENVLIQRIEGHKTYPDRFQTIKIHDTLAKEIKEHRVLTSYFEQDDVIYKMSISQEVSSSLHRLNRNYLYIFISSMMVILIGTKMVNAYINKSVWAPFYDVLEKIKDFNLLGQSKIAFQESSVKEFNELNKNIDLLLNRVTKDYQSQKEFIENSSHEFKTPLTIITQRLDLLIQSENLQQSELEHIQVIYDAARRMKNLNQHLTILYKLENRHFHERDEVNVWDRILYYINHFETKLIERQINITKFSSSDDFTVYCNAYLFDIILTNLISNAIKHNHDNGQIYLRLVGSKFEIINTGDAIMRKKEEIFTRYTKVSNSEVSSGLGLSIVKKIVDFYGWQIDYNVFENLHSFIIYFDNSTEEEA